MFDTFNDRARRAVDIAREAAGAARGAECGVEHLVLGIAGAGESGGAAILEELGLTEAKLRAALGVPADAVARPVSFSATALRAVELAKETAARLGHEGVDSLHLLIGIVGCGGDGALARIGLDVAEARVRVAEVFGVQMPRSRLHPDVREWIAERVRAEAAQLHADVADAVLDRAIDLAGSPGAGAPADGPVRRLVRRAIALRHGGDVLEIERALDAKSGPEHWALLRRQAEALPPSRISVSTDDLARAAKELES